MGGDGIAMHVELGVRRRVPGRADAATAPFERIRAEASPHGDDARDSLRNCRVLAKSERRIRHRADANKRGVGVPTGGVRFGQEPHGRFGFRRADRLGQFRTVQPIFAMDVRRIFQRTRDRTLRASIHRHIRAASQRESTKRIAGGLFDSHVAAGRRHRAQMNRRGAGGHQNGEEVRRCQDPCRG